MCMRKSFKQNLCIIDLKKGSIYEDFLPAEVCVCMRNSFKQKLCIIDLKKDLGSRSRVAKLIPYV